jgi:hypothetical protein
MKPRRPGAVTAFALLSLLFGVLFLMCSVWGLIPSKVEWNGVDITPRKQAYMSNAVPGYAFYQIGILVGLRLLLGVGFIASGVGLLQLWGWARFLAMACGPLLILYQLFGTIYELALVNPALNKFNADAPIRLGNWFSVVETVLAIAIAVVGIAFGVALVIVMLRPGTAKAFSGEPAEEDELEDDLPQRRRRRRGEDEEEDEALPRKPVRRPRPAEDVDEAPPPRPRPLRRRPAEEDDE